MTYMSFNEISKKLIKLNTWKITAPTIITFLILGVIVTKSIVYAIIFSACYSILMLVMLHIILVFKVKRKLKTCNSKSVFYCQNKKSALLVHQFLLVEEACKIVLIPFEYGVTDLSTELTMAMIKNKNSLKMDGKAYHLIELK